MHRLHAVVRHSWWTSSDAGRRTGRPRLRVAAVAAAALALSALSACSSAVTGSGSSGSTTPAATSSAATSAPAAASTGTGSATVGISAVPAGAQADYAHYNLYAKLYPNAYQNFKAPTGKVQYCETTFYLGNTYQQGEVTAYKQMVSQLAAAGKAQSNFIVENSNNNTGTQVSQFQSEIQSGCNVIFLDAG